MYIQKECLIITFKSTTDAMALEKYCREKNIEGRIIPLPGTISAGCGLAWSTRPELSDFFQKELQSANLKWERMHVTVV